MGIQYITYQHIYDLNKGHNNDKDQTWLKRSPVYFVDDSR